MLKSSRYLLVVNYAMACTSDILYDDDRTAFKTLGMHIFDNGTKTKENSDQFSQKLGVVLMCAWNFRSACQL